MPYKVARPVFTVFRGYFDESGDGRNIFTLSCVLAKPSNWGFLINDWTGVIDAKNNSLRAQGRQEISRFHAVDCSNFAEEFTGWSEPERKEFLGNLIKALERPANGINAVGYSVRLDCLVNEIPETKPDPKAFAYALLLKVIVQELGNMMNEANHGVTSNISLPLIHDRSRYNGVLLRAFDDLMLDPNFRYKRMFPSLVPMSWEDCPFLQVADFMAYENFKEDERHMTGRDRRYPLRKLLDGDVFGGKAGSFDEQGMARLKAFLTEELKQQILLEANLLKGKT